MLALHHQRPPIDFEQLGGIVAAEVHRYRRLFQLFPDLGFNDLHQEGMIAACMEHDNYDPSRWMYAAWIARAVRRRLLTIARERRRECE